MKKSVYLIAGILAFSLLIGMFALAAKGKPQENCPVTNKPIDKQVFTDYKGMRIYFCGKECIAPFLKSPDSFIKKMVAAGFIPEKVAAKNWNVSTAGCGDSCGSCPSKSKCK